MIALLFAAAVSTGLTADRALQLLEREYANIEACDPDHRRSLRDAIERTQVSQNPNIVLLTVFDSCLCFAQNCPFWVYHVGTRSATKILESVAVGVKVVPSNGATPDIDFIAHESAMRKNEWRYSYRNGTYVESQAWRVYRDSRKPVSIPVRFAPGTASTRLSGTVGVRAIPACNDRSSARSETRPGVDGGPSGEASGEWRIHDRGRSDRLRGRPLRQLRVHAFNSLTDAAGAIAVATRRPRPLGLFQKR